MNFPSGSALKSDDKIVFTSPEGADILYSLNGGEEQLYTNPFAVVSSTETSATLVAWTQSGTEISDELTDRYTYSADFYDITDYRYPSFMIFYFDAFEEPLKNEPVMAVTSVVEADNGREEKSCFIHGISAAGDYIIEVDDRLDKLPEKNDVIRYRLFGGKIVKWDLMHRGDSDDFSVNTMLDDIFYAFRGNIISVNSDAVTVFSDGSYENYTISPSVKVFSLEPGSRSVFTAASPECITRDDKIFFKAWEGIINEIYVWK